MSEFQSTPPRGKRLAESARGLCGSLVNEVSIHAPAREATRDARPLRSALSCKRVSIHAPAREATSLSQVRSAYQSSLTVSAPVSIHAPAREATAPADRPPASRSPGRSRRFQSTPPRGKRLAVVAGSCRRSLAVADLLRALFQSTPPRGKRLRRSAGSCGGRSRHVASARFNPRPRAGSDADAV